MQSRWIVAMFSVLLMFMASACDTVLVSGGISPGADAPLITPQHYMTYIVGIEHLLIDVRTPGEVSGGVISGAINIPVFQISQRASEIPKDKLIVIYSKDGTRSRDAVEVLRAAGFTNMLDLGGTDQWVATGYELVQPQ